MKKNVAILIPYFGVKPIWFDYFLYSCQNNPGFDWYFFTDCLSANQNIRNIHFIEMTLADFNRITSEKLGFEVGIRHPYKLCELKPAFGKIFQEYITGYKFWGYGDLDLVYGNINSFLPDNWMDSYDIITSNGEFVPGHFCLLKNSEKITELFTQGVNYQKIFQSQWYHGYDEVLHPIKIFPDGVLYSITFNIKLTYHLCLSAFRKLIKKSGIIKSGNRISDKSSKLKDFSAIVKQASWNNTVRVFRVLEYLDDIKLKRTKDKNWKLILTPKNLKLVKNGREIVYFHFQILKHADSFLIRDFQRKTQSIEISREGLKCE